MSTEIAIIRRAREIISDPEKWCQGAEARDEKGENCLAIYAGACRWCAWGALVKAASELVPFCAPSTGADAAAEHIKQTALPTGDFFELHIINDHQGHAAVLSLFDKAIASEVSP